MTATAVVGSAAEDTTPSEREAPQRFAWWHPRSADLGRHKARREEHAPTGSAAIYALVFTLRLRGPRVA